MLRLRYRFDFCSPPVALATGGKAHFLRLCSTSVDMKCVSDNLIANQLLRKVTACSLGDRKARNSG